MDRDDHDLAVAVVIITNATILSNDDAMIFKVDHLLHLLISDSENK